MPLFYLKFQTTSKSESTTSALLSTFTGVSAPPPLPLEYEGVFLYGNSLLLDETN